MTTEQHLNAIVLKCKANLALAEKRTQGKWGIEQTEGTNWIGPMRKCGDGKINFIVVNTDRYGLMTEYIEQNDANARYIAACAGAAEAGWRSTIAAIEGLKLSCCQQCDGSGVINHGGSGEGEESLEYCPANCQGIFDEAHKALIAIIAAWPEELL